MKSGSKIPPVLGVVLLLIYLHKTQAGSSKCLAPETIDYSLREEFCDQPLFVNLLPKTEEFELMDNICYTFFPLPDDPSTFTVYEATVYCDGSSRIQTFIATQTGIGVATFANPFTTYNVYTIGYAGCDTYITYGCQDFGDVPSFVLSLSTQCKAIGLSCLRKVQEVLDDRCIPEQDFYILPMKLPNRCVTQQLCVLPSNPFYNSLPGVALL